MNRHQRLQQAAVQREAESIRLEALQAYVEGRLRFMLALRDGMTLRDAMDEQFGPEVTAIALADGSPYMIDTLPTYPGDDVQCSGNCRCSVDGPGGE